MANTTRPELQAFSSIDIGKDVFHLVGFDSIGQQRNSHVCTIEHHSVLSKSLWLQKFFQNSETLCT
jgi:hypothetical protein